jgi:hypothetical protein
MLQAGTLTEADVQELIEPTVADYYQTGGGVSIRFAQDRQTGLRIYGIVWGPRQDEGGGPPHTVAAFTRADLPGLRANYPSIAKVFLEYADRADRAGLMP